MKYTLDQLKTMKRKWIKEAEEHNYFDDLLILVTEMGVEFQHELPHGWNKEKALRLKTGNLTIEAYFRNGKYLPVIGDYEITILVRAQMKIEEQQYIISNYIHATHQLKTDEQHDQSLFIPGEWWGSIQRLIDDSKKRLEARDQASKEDERQKLADELLIGKDI